MFNKIPTGTDSRNVFKLLFTKLMLIFGHILDSDVNLEQGKLIEATSQVDKQQGNATTGADSTQKICYLLFVPQWRN